MITGTAPAYPVLQTVASLLGQIIITTLFQMSIFKCTIPNTLKYRRFLPSVLSPQTSHPRLRPRYSRCLKCQQVPRSLSHLLQNKKNPEVLVQGSQSL